MVHPRLDGGRGRNRADCSGSRWQRCLAAFGGDSAIELFSAAAVLWRFYSTEDRAEATASKLTGWLLIALAAYTAFDCLYTLIVAESKPRPSCLGIILLAAAGFVMPLHARRKRRLAAAASRSCSSCALMLPRVRFADTCPGLPSWVGW
jgi:hypothetical protein